MGFELVRVMRACVFADVRPTELEQTLQEWLTANNSCRMVQMTQSQSGAGLVTLTIVYRKAERTGITTAAADATLRRFSAASQGLL